jgi:KaiC/GvpD/RAD55 family RecA-like ATPase
LETIKTSVSTGFDALDALLDSGIERPACLCINSKMRAEQHAFVLEMVHSFLEKGSRGLYVCIDKAENEVKKEFKNLNLDIEKYSQDYSIFFLDLFSESQNTFLNKEALNALVYDQNKLLEMIIPLLDWIKNGFIVFDTTSTLILNTDANVYSFIRGMKMLAKSFNLVAIGQMSTLAIDRSKAEAVRSNADYVFSIRNNVIFIENQKTSAINNQALHIIRDPKGRISLNPTCDIEDYKQIVLRLLSKFDSITIKPIMTLEISPHTDIQFELLLPMLEKLESEGEIDSTPSCTNVACPKCNSQKIRINLACPECQNLALKKSGIIEHLNCRYSDFLSNFEKQEKLVCPKCNKELTQIGVDYAKIGTGYQCSNKHIFPAPEISFECLACKEKFDMDSWHLEVQKNYNIKQERKENIKQSSLEFACSPEGFLSKKQV